MKNLFFGAIALVVLVILAVVATAMIGNSRSNSGTGTGGSPGLFADPPIRGKQAVADPPIAAVDQFPLSPTIQVTTCAEAKVYKAQSENAQFYVYSIPPNATFNVYAVGADWVTLQPPASVNGQVYAPGYFRASALCK